MNETILCMCLSLSYFTIMLVTIFLDGAKKSYFLSPFSEVAAVIARRHCVISGAYFYSQNCAPKYNIPLSGSGIDLFFRCFPSSHCDDVTIAWASFSN